MAKGEKNRDVNVHREWAKLWMGIFLVFFGMGIMAYSLIVEPQGKIDYSVVTAFGGVLTWAGAMFGMDSHSKIKMHEQDKYFEAKKLELENEMRKFRYDRTRDIPEESAEEG